jgi:soluble lytic murein transglycosylase-like protein
MILDILYYIYLGTNPQVDAILASPACAQFSYLVKHESAVAGVDATLVARLLKVESNCKANAVNKRTRDKGLMQVNRIHKISRECLLDPRCGIRAGVSVLADMQKRVNFRPCVYNLGNKVDDNPKTCYIYEKKLANLN